MELTNKSNEIMDKGVGQPGTRPEVPGSGVGGESRGGLLEPTSKSPMDCPACAGTMNDHSQFCPAVYETGTGAENRMTLDTTERVFFYEQDFYVLSNFSSFRVSNNGLRHQTAEHAYHYMKFCTTNQSTADLIYDASSAHNAFKIAEANKWKRRKDWDKVKVDIMRQILIAKVTQHEYVQRKLLATGTRELIENSWRDDFWGWGPQRNGQNMLGKLWMNIRADLRSYLESGK